MRLVGLLLVACGVTDESGIGASDTADDASDTAADSGETDDTDSGEPDDTDTDVNPSEAPDTSVLEAVTTAEGCRRIASDDIVVVSEDTHNTRFVVTGEFTDLVDGGTLSIDLADAAALEALPGPPAYYPLGCESLEEQGPFPEPTATTWWASAGMALIEVTPSGDLFLDGTVRFTNLEVTAADGSPVFGWADHTVNVRIVLDPPA